MKRSPPYSLPVKAKDCSATIRKLVWPRDLNSVSARACRVDTPYDFIDAIAAGASGQLKILFEHQQFTFVGSKNEHVRLFGVTLTTRITEQRKRFEQMRSITQQTAN